MTKSEVQELYGDDARPLPDSLKHALPGTTISTANGAEIKHKYRNAFDGPQIDGKPTTISLFQPPGLMESSLLPSIQSLLNRSFSAAHTRFNLLPAGVDRLEIPEQFLSELGADPGTFTLIVQFSGSDDVVATASAHRYIAPVFIVDQGAVTGRKVFSRMKPPRGGPAEYWELKLMAVDPRLQRQGLAGLLMQLVEDQIKRVYSASYASLDDSAERPKLYSVLTTMKEVNHAFYVKRGYVDDYETSHGPGELGSETGFSIIHMSKRIDDVEGLK